jgi:ATP-dependent DNA helicase RecQ
MLEEILKKFWNHDSFRPLQKEIAESVIQGHDTLALLPTGGGKSICFQVPALYLDGLCLVVSPLIALMKDQVMNLKNKGIPAEMVYSGMKPNELTITLENACRGNYKFLYVSPERLQTEIFLEKITFMNLCIIAVDEAHCISQWGYDFRPSYLKIAKLRELYPHIPIVALTATATPKVIDDIAKNLCFKPNYKLFKSTFARKNLALVVRETESKEKEILKILKNKLGPTIIYTRNRTKTEQFSKFLSNNGIPATFYHAGMSQQAKDKAMLEWLDEKVSIMVATNAFGMGIDKPNVRMVIHLDTPDSPEAYFQEAGRAGRDEKKSFAVLLKYANDKQKLMDEFQCTYPDLKFIRTVYHHIGNYLKLAMGCGYLESFDFDINEFCTTLNLPKRETFYALKRLEENEYLEYLDTVNWPASVFFTCNIDQLYEFVVKESQKITNTYYPSLESVVKWLLRKHGGALFSQYVTLNLKKMAKELDCTEEQIIKSMEYLQKLEFCRFNPPKTQPQLVFLQPRKDINLLYFDTQKIKHLKSAHWQRIQAMIDYITNTTQCRMQFLQHYFGEEAPEPCGICDVCLHEKKEKIKSTLTQQIHEILDKHPSASFAMLIELTRSQKKILEECLDELVKFNKIYINKNGNFCKFRV